MSYRKGVTLIELIAVVVIVSVAFAALMAVLSTVTRRAWDSDNSAKTVLCAQSRMERSLIQGFNVTNSTATCPDGTGYSVTVNNVTLAANNTWVLGTSNPPYKSINVKAWRGGGISTSVYCLVNNQTT
jgi:prepilin-type N-terminal cleavage/methylation domain-containing protein